MRATKKKKKRTVKKIVKRTEDFTAMCVLFIAASQNTVGTVYMEAQEREKQKREQKRKG